MTKSSVAAKLKQRNKKKKGRCKIALRGSAAAEHGGKRRAVPAKLLDILEPVLAGGM